MNNTPPLPKFVPRKIVGVVQMHDYAAKITIGGKATVLVNCPDCGFAPHFPLDNGLKICGFCGREHGTAAGLVKGF